MKVSAYVPCFNNAATLEGSVESILIQGIPREDVCVIDDGSSDSSVATARRLNVRVIVNEGNQGRGFTRARATREARHDLVLACDAGKILPRDFLKTASAWMDQDRVAAVFGRLVGGPDGNWVARWEKRHIFMEQSPGTPNRRARLQTTGFLARRSQVLSVGNFNERLRHSEDTELGDRLLAAGLEVVYDPSLRIACPATTRLGPLLERYWRWHAGADEKIDFRGYARNIVYSIRVLARMDCRAGDFTSVPISLIVPHHQFWRSFWRKLRPSPSGVSHR